MHSAIDIRSAAYRTMSYGAEALNRATVETGPVLARRGALAVHADPPEISWRGQPIALSPLEQALVTILIIRGRAPWQAFEAELGISAETRDTLVHRIRRKFRKARAPDPIETIRHWGLRLRAAPDGARGTAARFDGNAR